MLLNARGNEDDEDESLVLLLKPSTTFAFEFLSISKFEKKRKFCDKAQPPVVTD